MELPIKVFLINHFNTLLADTAVLHVLWKKYLAAAGARSGGQVAFTTGELVVLNWRDVLAILVPLTLTGCTHSRTRRWPSPEAFSLIRLPLIGLQSYNKHWTCVSTYLDPLPCSTAIEAGIAFPMEGISKIGLTTSC